MTTDSSPDAPRARASHLAFRDAATAGTDGTDSDALFARLSEHLGGLDGVAAARLWLSAADEWLGGNDVLRAEALRRAYTAAEEHEELTAFLDRTFEAQGDAAGVEASVRAAITRDAGNIGAQERLGVICARSGRFDEATSIATALAESGLDGATAALSILDQVDRDSEIPSELVLKAARGAGDERRVLQALETRFRAEPNSSGNIARFADELAEQCLKVTRDPEAAFTTLDDAWDRAPDERQQIYRSASELALDADNGGLVSRTAEFATELEIWPDVIKLHRWLAEKATTSGGRVDHLLVVAGTLANNTNDVSAAIDTYVEIVATDQNASSTVEEKLAALERTADAEARAQIRRARSQLLGARGDFVQLHDVLIERINDAADADRPALLLELATLQTVRLGRPDLAVIAAAEAASASNLTPEVREAVVAQLESLIKLEPAAERAALALASLQEDEGDMEAVAATLEVAATHARKPEDRAAHFARIGEIRLARGESELAADAFTQATAEDPAGGYEPRLRQILDELGRHAEALGLIQREIDRAAPNQLSALHLAQADLFARSGAPDEAVQILHGLGDDGRAAFAELIGREDGPSTARAAASSLVSTERMSAAADLLWDAADALGLDSTDAIALASEGTALGQVSAERIETLLEAIEEQPDEVRVSAHQAVLAQSRDDEVMLASNLALGRLLSTKEPTAAADAFVAVIDLEPDHEEALDGLLAVLRERGEAGPIVEALEHRLEHMTLSEDEAVEHLSEIVDLYADALGRPDLAFPYCRSILQFQPAHERALTLVQESTSDDLGLRYEVLAEGVEELEGDGLAKRHEALAEIALKFGSAERAAEHRISAAGADGADEKTRVESARSAAELGFSVNLPHIVLAAFRAELPLLTDERGPRAEEIIDRLAELGLDHALEAAGAALEGWEAPEGGVLDRHAQLARRNGDHATAAASLARWIDRDGDAVPQDRRVQLALVSFEAAPASDAAWQRCAEALARAPGQMDLVMKVEELRGDGNRTRGLAAAIAAIAEKFETDDRVAALYRAAEFVASEDEAVAEAYWTAILDADPSQSKAMKRLRGAMRERGDDDAEAALLRGRLESADDAQRVAMLTDLAALAKDDESIEAAHKDVLAADPSVRASRTALADLFERQERYCEAIEVLEAGPGQTPEERREFHGRIAGIARTKLEDPLKTIAALEKLVEDDATDQTSLVELTQLYVAQEAWSDVARTTDRLAGLQNDDERRARILERLAGVHEKQLGDLDGAIDAWARVVEIEPSNLTALEELARLYEASEAWDSLVETLEKIAGVANIPGLRQEILMRAAPVLLVKLDRPSDALNLYVQAIVGGAPTTDAVIESVGLAAEATGDWAAWCNAIRAVTAAEENEERRTAHELSIADALVDKLNDPRSAVGWLVECIARAPRLGPLLERVEEIADANDLQSELVETYKQLTAANTDDPETVWHALERSRDLAETLGHPETAFGIMVRATETPALAERAGAELERLAKAHELWSQYADYLDAVGEEQDDSTAAAVRRAEVQADELNDWEAAFETLVTAFQENPFDERVTTPLYALADKHEAWPFVAKLLELLQEDAEPDQKTRFLSEIAAVYGDRLGNASEAFAQELRAWQVDPRDADLRGRLERRAAATGREVDLLAAFEWLTKQPGEPSEVDEAFDRAASLALRLNLLDRAVALHAAKAIGRPDGLEEVLAASRTSLEAHPSAVSDVARTISVEGDPVLGTRALQAAARFASEREDHAESVDLLRTALVRAPAPAELRPALIEAIRATGDLAALAAELEEWLGKDSPEPIVARSALEELRDLYRDRLGDPEQAAEIGRRLMALDPTSSDARSQYQQQLRDLERWPELVEHLLGCADTEPDADTATSLRLDAAAIAEEYLDDSRRAQRIAESILEMSPSNPQALELRARALAGVGRWQEHIDALELLAKASEPEAAARVYAQAALVYEHNLAYTDKALDAWTAAATADPRFGQALAEQGRLSGELGDYEASFEHWKAATEHLEGRLLATALVNLAQAGQLAGAELDVVATLRRAVEVDPHSPLARSAYEEALIECGDIDAIMGLLDRELETAEGEARAEVYLRRAAVQFFDVKNESNALKSLQAAEEGGLTRAAAALRADIHLVGGRWAEAVADYRTALGNDDQLDPRTLAPRTLFPGEDPSRHDATTIFLFRAGYASEGGGRHHDAQDYYASSNLEDGAFAPAIVGLARLAVRQGNSDGAALYISSYRGAGPGVPELDAEVADLAKRIGGE